MAIIRKQQVEVEGRWHEEEVIVEQDDLAPWADKQPMTHVGRGRPRTDAEARVTGTAKYTYDVAPPGMLWAGILHSPYPHARVKSIDTSRAAALPGVRCILTHDDCRHIAWNDDTPLLTDIARFHGDEIAAVAAESEAVVADALELVSVEYEELPFVVDPVAALAEGAVEIHPGSNPGGNRAAPPEEYSRGDVERGFAEAEVVIEARYRTPAAVHNSFEPHGSVAMWENDLLTVWDTTQHIFGIRAELAEKLSIPLNKVRVISQYMGGGFGAKNGLSKATALAAIMARKTRRPVKLMLTREQENLASGHRPPAVVDIELGARKDGTLTAVRARAISTAGAYGGYGFSICGPMHELYRCDNVETVQEEVFINTGPSCAFRGPGYVEGIFALDSAMDELAAALDMDPLELRLANYADSNQVRQMPYSAKHLRESYRSGAAAIGRHERSSGGDGRRRRGIGMASQVWGGGGAPPSYATMRVNADGTFDLATGTQDLGTGTKTVMTQVAAEELGVAEEKIRITIGDTLACPYSLLSAGSLTVPSVSPAVRNAASEVKRQLLDLAAAMLETDAAQLDIRNGDVVACPGGERKLTVDEVAAKAGNYMIIGKGARGPNPTDSSVNTFGVQFAEVEVDTDTGEVTVLRVVAAHEFGRVLNPLTLSSQIEGGVLQGVGYGTLEERVMDTRIGRVVNANLTDYQLPTAMDTPEITSLFTGPPDTVANNVGAKGAGEPPIIPTAPAIANAVYAATGARIREIPITPARVLEALRKGGEE